ncbi:MAG: hypothetical protein R3A51_08565 [Nannocystaceae bacterium]|nr:hypothetical protein [Myxococcales bacterium]
MRTPLITLSAIVCLALGACDPSGDEAKKAAPVKAEAKAEAKAADESKAEAAAPPKSLPECVKSCDGEEASETDRETCKLNCQQLFPEPKTPLQRLVGDFGQCVATCHDEGSDTDRATCSMQCRQVAGDDALKIAKESQTNPALKEPPGDLPVKLKELEGCVKGCFTDNAADIKKAKDCSSACVAAVKLD